MYAVFVFLGSWTLYIFPMYQGSLEISEQHKVIDQLTNAEKDYPQVPPWLWICPPLKLIKEKKRGIRILREHMTNEQDYHDLLVFSDKATTWLYISVAGLLNGLASTWELIKLVPVPERVLVSILIDVLFIVLGILHILFRRSEYREQRLVKKFNENN